MNPDPATIKTLKAAGFEEHLISCPHCGITGLAMIRPEYGAPPCVQCGEPYILVSAPASKEFDQRGFDQTKRDWTWRDWSWWRPVVRELAFIIAVIAAFLGAVVNLKFFAVAYCLMTVAYMLTRTDNAKTDSAKHDNTKHKEER